MNLETLRQKIDRIDQQILNLLSRRIELARQIGRTKARAGQDVFDPARETALLKKLQKSKSALISNQALKSIYREIFSSARSIQKKLTIAYVEKAGSSEYIVARHFFGACANYKKFTSPVAVQKALAKRSCDYWITDQKPNNLFQLAWKVKDTDLDGKTFYILQKPNHKHS